jgi:hypothetical protein
MLLGIYRPELDRLERVRIVALGWSNRRAGHALLEAGSSLKRAACALAARPRAQIALMLVGRGAPCLSVSTTSPLIARSHSPGTHQVAECHHVGPREHLEAIHLFAEAQPHFFVFVREVAICLRHPNDRALLIQRPAGHALRWASGV